MTTTKGCSQEPAECIKSLANSSFQQIKCLFTKIHPSLINTKSTSTWQMTCPGPVHKTHGTILLLIWKQKMMQGVLVAILTFSLGTGKCKGDRKPSRNSVLICVRRDFCVLTMFFTSTAPHPFSFGASLTGWGLTCWFCVSSGILFLAGAAPKYLCTYYDIVDYLNISSHNKLHTYILPKINLKEPVEVKMDFMLVAILSVVSTQNESLQQETGLLLGQGLI